MRKPAPMGRGLGEGKTTRPTKSLRDRARELRQNQTDAEKRLWSRLRNRQLADIKFRRQTPIGRYIVDFYCHEHRLIVELDGGQHHDNQKDVERDHWLATQGYHVLRYWNHGVLANTEGVLEDILLQVDPHPNPLPTGEGTNAPQKPSPSGRGLGEGINSPLPFEAGCVREQR